MRVTFPWQKPGTSLERSGPPLGLNEWANTYLGQYPLYGYGPTYPDAKLEEIATNFRGHAGGGYMGNVIVFACVLARLQVFSQATFKFRELRQGRPGNYFGNRDLVPLEQPEPGKNTGDLLSRMETDVSLAGNWFGLRNGTRVKRLRPDWMAIALTGEEDDPDAEVVGYIYWPGGQHSGHDPIPLLRDEVAHYAPIPDPLAQYRGMSWLTPVIREVMLDSGFRDHKIKFLEKGGTHNFLYRFDPQSITKDQFESFTSAYKARHEGAEANWQSIFIRAAVDATPLGTNFKDSDLRGVQGAGETRIAAAAGVPPIVAGFSEGLEAATYSNYAQARRRFVDGTVRHLWKNAANSLATIIEVPPAAELWYDDRDIPALREDLKERADVQQAQSVSMKTLIDAGFDPDSVRDAVNAEDFARLKHTGKVSVQLQDPGAQPAGERERFGPGRVACRLAEEPSDGQTARRTAASRPRRIRPARHRRLRDADHDRAVRRPRRLDGDQVGVRRALHGTVQPHRFRKDDQGIRQADEGAVPPRPRPGHRHQAARAHPVPRSRHEL